MGEDASPLKSRYVFPTLERICTLVEICESECQLPFGERKNKSEGKQARDLPALAI